ncbi:MAG: YncE family protein, partial [Candidatus Kapaibacterium sp.]
MSSSLLARSRALCLFVLLALTVPGVMSCTSTDGPDLTPPPALDSAVMVVNQGLFGLDNASLSRIRPDNSVDLSWFSAANASRKLGGTANDIAFLGDTAFISVTKSHAIEVINAKTGRHLGTMLLPVSYDPWEIEVISRSLACVSTTNGDGVQFFNPSTLTLLDHVVTGPATQGVAATATQVFVANSGYGTLRDTVTGAGTVSVIDIASRTVTAVLNIGKNVTEVQLSPDRKRLYAYYQELYTNPTAKQGIVEVDVATWK